ncbi:conserved hypothetical protein [Candidatus Terasakiella magnetica]|nr:conserved hypothetical protein [Candidatus Terasakiella magnetica]
MPSLRLAILLLAFAAAGCGEIPQPFRHEGINAALAPRVARGVVVRLADDAPQASALGQAVIKKLVEAEVPVPTRETVLGVWVLSGIVDRGADTVFVSWTLTPPGGEAMANLRQKLPAIAWGAATPRLIETLATEVVARMIGPLHGEADAPAPSQAAAAPRLAVLLAPLAGLPGDGDKALGGAMRRLLQRAGYQVVDKGEAQFAIRGQVSITPGPPGEEILSVAWTVSRGAEDLGSAAQNGAVPKGRLAGPWGSLAGDIAAGGVEGVVQIIEAASGK